MDNYVDFSFGEIIKVKTDSLNKFRQIAKSNEKKKRYRLCLHDTPKNQLQDMLICMVKGDYIRPHKHCDMPESHLVVRGQAIIVIFYDNGEIKETFLLGRGGYLMYRINADIYHMTLLESETFIEYEVKPGPFCPDNNIYPTWAPDGKNGEEVRDYIKRLEEKISAMSIGEDDKYDSI